MDNGAVLFGTGSVSFDVENGEIYCDGTTQIHPGGDDAGTIETVAGDAADRLACSADTTAVALGKLAAASIKYPVPCVALLRPM